MRQGRKSTVFTAFQMLPCMSWDLLYSFISGELAITVPMTWTNKITKSKQASKKPNHLKFCRFSQVYFLVQVSQKILPSLLHHAVMYFIILFFIIICIHMSSCKSNEDQDITGHFCERLRSWELCVSAIHHPDTNSKPEQSVHRLWNINTILFSLWQ